MFNLPVNHIIPHVLLLVGWMLAYNGSSSVDWSVDRIFLKRQRSYTSMLLTEPINLLHELHVVAKDFISPLKSHFTSFLRCSVKKKSYDWQGDDFRQENPPEDALHYHDSHWHPLNHAKHRQYLHHPNNGGNYQITGVAASSKASTASRRPLNRLSQHISNRKTRDNT